MKIRYTLSITVPNDQCVTPNTVAHVLREAADIMEWQQPDGAGEDDASVSIKGERKPGCPAWILVKGAV